MNWIAGILGAGLVALCLAGVIAAWIDAIDTLKAEHGEAPSAARVLGGVGILLAGMGGAALGMVAVAMALEVVR